jgi:isopentenyldiphosphate isomerase
MPDGRRDTLVVAEGRIGKALHEKRWPLNASLGYLAGLGVPAVPEVSRLGLSAAATSTFFNSPLQTILTSLALLCVFAYVLLAPILQKRAAMRTLDRSLLAAYGKFVDPLFLDHDHELEGIAWGKGQTVLACPRPQQGWHTREIRFRVNRTPYSFRNLQDAAFPTLKGRALAEEYEHFRDQVFPAQFGSDAEKWMLVRRPRSFTEDLGLRLDLQVTCWSQLQFFWQQIATAENKSALYSAALDSDPIPYPTSFCLHLLVFSSEGALLLTQAHPSKTNDYPSSWAVSLGEQLASEDLTSLDQDCAQKWVIRALHEELSIEESECDPEQIRFLALSFEGDISNLAFICAVHLRLPQEDITARLRTSNRLDNEFNAIEFISVDRVPHELVSPSRTYHPSAGIRMVYAYLHEHGQNALRRSLARELQLPVAHQKETQPH